MSDATWAADRYAEIKDEHDTSGVFYDEDGQRHGFSSGDEKGSDAERANRALRDVGLSSLLPPGASLRVWFPRLDGSGMDHQDYAGR